MGETNNQIASISCSCRFEVSNFVFSMINSMDIILRVTFQRWLESNGEMRVLLYVTWFILRTYACILNVCRWTVPFKLNKHNLKLFQTLRKANASDCLLKFYSIAVIKCVCLSTIHGTLTFLLLLSLLLSVCVCARVFLSILCSWRSRFFSLKINKPHRQKWKIILSNQNDMNRRFLIVCFISPYRLLLFFKFFLLILPAPKGMALQIKLTTSTAFIGFNSSNLFYQGFSNGIRNVPLIIFICYGEIEISLSIFIAHTYDINNIFRRCE